jgi:hypothetical protein
MAPPTGDLVLSADDWLAKQLQRTLAAGDAWLRGVQSPRRNAKDGALKAVQKYKNAMQASLSSGKWEKSIAKIDDAVTQAVIAALGPGVFTQGVKARTQKIQAALEKLRPLLLSHTQAIAAMPDNTDAEREAKMIANLRGMRGIGAKLRGM